LGGFLLIYIKNMPKNQPAKTWKEKLKPSKGVMVFFAVPMTIGLSLGIVGSMFPECATVSCLLEHVF